jgi:hypothetical protein
MPDQHSLVGVCDLLLFVASYLHYRNTYSQQEGCGPLDGRCSLLFTCGEAAPDRLDSSCPIIGKLLQLCGRLRAICRRPGDGCLPHNADTDPAPVGLPPPDIFYSWQILHSLSKSFKKCSCESSIPLLILRRHCVILTLLPSAARAAASNLLVVEPLYDAAQVELMPAPQHRATR